MKDWRRMLLKITCKDPADLTYLAPTGMRRKLLKRLNESQWT